MVFGPGRSLSRFVALESARSSRQPALRIRAQRLGARSISRHPGFPPSVASWGNQSMLKTCTGMHSRSYAQVIDLNARDRDCRISDEQVARDTIAASTERYTGAIITLMSPGNQAVRGFVRIVDSHPFHHR